jgi:hypothetical protein
MRFDLRLPMELLRSGAQKLNSVTETRNVSSSGVLFASDSQLPVGEAIEYLLTLPGAAKGAPKVRLRCFGTVIRLEASARRTAKQKPFDVAATLERYEFVRNR